MGGVASRYEEPSGTSRVSKDFPQELPLSWNSKDVFARQLREEQRSVTAYSPEGQDQRV